MFSSEFCEIFKNTFSTEHLRTIAFVTLLLLLQLILLNYNSC